MSTHCTPRPERRGLRRGAGTRLLLATTLVAAAATLAVPSLGPSAGAAPAQAPEDPQVEHRRDDLDLELVSRSYDAGQDNWTIVAEATLSSNRICLPVVFNCIVGDDGSPAQASLVGLTCDTAGWNHLVVFRNHCMKQLLFAGHDQKFTFTWRTDPGVGTGTVDLAIEFGRGVLPAVFQQLATAQLTVDLDTSLDVSKECPTQVDAGEELQCSVVVAHPGGPSSGPALSGITLTDTPDAALGALVTGAALAHTGGAGTWNCAATECADGELSPGESAQFAFTATAAEDPEGGNGSNEASLQWTTPAPGGPVTADDTVTVVGTGDTQLGIEKSTTDTEVAPGGRVTWSVVVTNEGPLDATGEVVEDLAPDEVDDLELVHTDGVGEWSCSATTCTAATMPVGSATFSAGGTVAAGTAADTSIVNEVAVAWANNILGPDFPITAGSAVPVVASATTTTTPGSTTVPGRGGAPLSIAG